MVQVKLLSNDYHCKCHHYERLQRYRAIYEPKYGLPTYKTLSDLQHWAPFMAELRILQPGVS